MSTEGLARRYHSVTQERVESLLAEMPAQATREEMADIFKTLGEPVRVRIVYLLWQEELCVHDMAVILGMSQSAVSHHLKILRLMRLVKPRKEGRHIYYSLDDEHVLELLRACSDHVKHGKGRR